MIYRRFVFYWKVLKESIISFVDDNMLTYAAALSYYTVFSMPAILLIVLWTAAQFCREVTVHEAILQKITSLTGEQVAQQAMSTIEKMSIQEPTWLATVVGIGVLLFFATTVFDTMRTALNQVSRAKAPDSIGLSIWMALRVRLIALALLIGISFLTIISLTMDAILTTLNHYLSYWIGELSEYSLVLDMFMLDLIVTTLLFAFYLRYLPDSRLKWSDAFFGALLTAGLFAVGKYLMGMFISNNQIVDLYDAAGSLLVLMLWVYYASAVFLFGAVFTFTRVRKNVSES